MDDWLSTLIGTAIVGGAIYVTSKEARKDGYNAAMLDVAKMTQEQEISNLRAELNALKTKQIT